MFFKCINGKIVARKIKNALNSLQKESLRTQYFARFHLNCRISTTAFLYNFTERKVVSPFVPIYPPHSQG